MGSIANIPTLVAILAITTSCMGDESMVLDLHENHGADESSVAVQTWSHEDPLEEDRAHLANQIRWVHPLAGDRQLPGRASREFGAYRPGHRPMECISGHCGVDIGDERGSVVHAAADGVIARINHSPWGKAGRYVILAHAGGVETAYLHLDEFRYDLEVGVEVRAGEAIATLGRTGIIHSDAHLHFGLSVTEASGRRYIDPLPLLEAAEVLQSPATLAPNLDLSVDEHLGVVVALRPVDTDAAPIVEVGSETIRLRVLDGHRRTALRGATVTAINPAGARVTGTIAPDGTWLLDKLAAGTWTIEARAAGYATVRRTLTADGTNAVELELLRSAYLEGEVRDENGERVVGASVRVGLANTTTDAQGRFRVLDAPTGEVSVEASTDSGVGTLDLNLAPGDELVTLQVNVSPE
jgi:hypothetical protein